MWLKKLITRLENYEVIWFKLLSIHFHLSLIRSIILLITMKSSASHNHHHYSSLKYYKDGRFLFPLCDNNWQLCCTLPANINFIQSSSIKISLHFKFYSLTSEQRYIILHFSQNMMEKNLCCLKNFSFIGQKSKV